MQNNNCSRSEWSSQPSVASATTATFSESEEQYYFDEHERQLKKRKAALLLRAKVVMASRGGSSGEQHDDQPHPHPAYWETMTPISQVAENETTLQESSLQADVAELNAIEMHETLNSLNLRKPKEEESMNDEEASEQSKLSIHGDLAMSTTMTNGEWESLVGQPTTPPTTNSREDDDSDYFERSNSGELDEEQRSSIKVDTIIVGRQQGSLVNEENRMNLRVSEKEEVSVETSKVQVEFARRTAIEMEQVVAWWSKSQGEQSSLKTTDDHQPSKEKKNRRPPDTLFSKSQKTDLPNNSLVLDSPDSHAELATRAVSPLNLQSSDPAIIQITREKIALLTPRNECAVKQIGQFSSPLLMTPITLVSTPCPEVQEQSLEVEESCKGAEHMVQVVQQLGSVPILPDLVKVRSDEGAARNGNIVQMSLRNRVWFAYSCFRRRLVHSLHHEAVPFLQWQWYRMERDYPWILNIGEGIFIALVGWCLMYAWPYFSSTDWTLGHVWNVLESFLRELSSSTVGEQKIHLDT